MPERGKSLAASEYPEPHASVWGRWGGGRRRGVSAQVQVKHAALNGTVDAILMPRLALVDGLLDRKSNRKCCLPRSADPWRFGNPVAVRPVKCQRPHERNPIFTVGSRGLGHYRFILNQFRTKGGSPAMMTTATPDKPPDPHPKKPVWGRKTLHL